MNKDYFERFDNFQDECIEKGISNVEWSQEKKYYHKDQEKDKVVKELMKKYDL